MLGVLHKILSFLFKSRQIFLILGVFLRSRNYFLLQILLLFLLGNNFCGKMFISHAHLPYLSQICFSEWDCFAKISIPLCSRYFHGHLRLLVHGRKVEALSPASDKGIFGNCRFASKWWTFCHCLKYWLRIYPIQPLILVSLMLGIIIIRACLYLTHFGSFERLLGALSRQTINFRRLGRFKHHWRPFKDHFLILLLISHLNNVIENLL